jgi:hypothetical protein
MERVRGKEQCIFALEKKKGSALSTHLGVVLRYFRLNCGAQMKQKEEVKKKKMMLDLHFFTRVHILAPVAGTLEDSCLKGSSTYIAS